MRLAIAASFFALFVELLGAQPALKFEVATVKQNQSEDFRNIGMKTMPGGRISLRNLPLFILIGVAYEVPFQSTRLSGGPDWIRGERYDVEAAPPEGAIPANATARERDAIVHKMLQSLLEERFKLVMHRETQEQPVYAVLVGKKGPKLDKSGMEEKGLPAGRSIDESGLPQLSRRPGTGLAHQVVMHHGIGQRSFGQLLVHQPEIPLCDTPLT